jgi:hypothetical protein
MANPKESFPSRYITGKIFARENFESMKRSKKNQEIMKINLKYIS